MKRFMALLLTVALSLSLSACGKGGNNAIDEENAIEATPTEVYEDVKENEAIALQNTYKVTGEIDTIEADCCQIDNLTVYLPSDTLVNLNIGDTITFVGTINDTRVEQKGIASRMYINFNNVKLIDE